MTRRFQFSLSELQYVYAAGILISGLMVVAVGVGQSALSATSADVLAENITPSMDQSEVRQAAFEFLETRNWRLRIALVITGIVVSLTSIPLFFAGTSEQ